MIADLKPDNILVNYGSSGTRFSDVKLADCGDSTHVDSVTEGHIIGATIFRSPEAMLNLIWGPATDIWSLGATARFPPRDADRPIQSADSVKLISLVWGENWHIFKPSNIDPTDPAYPIEVLRRQDKCFGPFPLSYTTLADDDRLDTLTIITESVEKRTPFERAASKEIAESDREFICKLMQLDPRDRPSANVLLQDAWFAEGTADSK